jgi:hypothetical protein
VSSTRYFFSRASIRVATISGTTITRRMAITPTQSWGFVIVDTSLYLLYWVCTD